ncbi:MAG TPA: ROK family protein [Balneolaceae bacterium]|nr:ROK family protein [Balneolaceae bacterium]
MIEVAAGIDVGGTTTKFGLVTKEGKVVSKKRISTDSSVEFNEFFQDLFRRISDLMNQNGTEYSLAGFGIGAPTGNCFTGNIDNASNLSWKGKIPIVRLTEDYFKLPAFLANDANAAALGEMIFGAARGMKNFAVITMGTGLGCGLVANGDLLTGHNGHAAEIGHSTVFYDGRLCSCGLKGCLETYVSGFGLLRTLREIAERSDKQGITWDAINNTNLTAIDITNAALRGDQQAIETFNYTGKILGMKLADLVTYFDPEAIILLGGLAKADSLILKPARKEMEKNLLDIYQNKVKLIVSEMNNDDAGILGAAATAWNGLNCKPELR